MPRLANEDTLDEDSDGQEGGAPGAGISLAERPSSSSAKTTKQNATNGTSPESDADVRHEEEADEDGGDDDDDDDDEEAEDEFEVEAIHGHEFRRKGKGPYTLLYNIKWKGYPDSDNTLEPEENLQDSRALLAAYHLSIGGAPQPPDTSTLSKKRSQKNLTSESPASTPPTHSKRRRLAGSDHPSRESEQIGSWVPKLSSWEDEIKLIETVERDPTTGDLFVYITFRNGKKSKVKRDMVHKHCPLAMLNFYEEHLNFEGPS